MATLYTLCISCKISFAPTSQHVLDLPSLCQHLHDSISVFQGLAPNGGHSDLTEDIPEPGREGQCGPPPALWSPLCTCLAEAAQRSEQTLLWVARVLAWSVYVTAWWVRQKTDLSHPFWPILQGLLLRPRTSEVMRWAKAMKSASPRLYNPES